MSEFTAADVKRLRDLTGAGMMSCKSALTEASGDFERAVEVLRVKGAKDIDKRAGRTAANGLVAHAGTALLELNCETDFVAKNAEFIALAQRLVDHAGATRPAEVPELLASTLPDGGTVADAVAGLAAKLGEKLVVNRFGVLDPPVAVYLHRKSPDLPPQVGVLVGYSRTGEPAAQAPDEASDADARGIAMQIAAMRPRYLAREEIPAEVLESERRIAEQTAREEGRPEGAVPKIVEGRVNAFFKDAVLVEQPSVTEQKQSVAQVLAATGVTVTGFLRFEVGRS